MFLAGNDGLNDGSAGGTQNVAGDHVQLDAGIFEDFVNPVVDAIAFFGQLDSVACQIAQLTRSPGRDEAGLDQTMSQQFGNPLAVAHVGLPAGNAFDLIRIGQYQMEASPPAPA